MISLPTHYSKKMTCPVIKYLLYSLIQEAILLSYYKHVFFTHSLIQEGIFFIQMAQVQ